MGRTVLVLGISGVGKSCLCARLAQRQDLVHVSASSLLRAAKEARSGEITSAERLRTGPVLDNQQLLVERFAGMRAEEARHILLDAHNIVDDDKALTRIPFEVFRDLGPSGIVFVSSDPRSICERRARDTTRTRPVRSFEVLEQHQREAMEAAQEDGGRLEVPLRVVEADDEAAFAAAVLVVVSAPEQ